jgi:hypothetical protein
MTWFRALSNGASSGRIIGCSWGGTKIPARPSSICAFALDDVRTAANAAAAMDSLWKLRMVLSPGGFGLTLVVAFNGAKGRSNEVETQYLNAEYWLNIAINTVTVC